MSLFCITQSKETAQNVLKDYNEIFPQKSNIYQLDNAVFLTVTNGFKERPVYKKVDDNSIFIFGTIFNEIGFNAEILEKIEDYENFWKLVCDKKHNFFGHYIIIGYNKNKEQLKIVTDRVGLLNVYYTRCPDLCISNDMIEVARISGKAEFDPQASSEFILTEANVNEGTIFQGIRRLGFGKGLLMENNYLNEIELYEYHIEHLNKNDYMERIDHYFKCINLYKGRVSVDISAGFDTRLIAAIAHKNINSFRGFSVNNESDGGIDNEISPIIAERLNVPITWLDYSDFRTNDDQSELIYHCTSGLRDANRSKKWKILFSRRFSDSDLSLGGYGGEILRAKYNIYPNIRQFVKFFYKGIEAEKIYGIINYKEALTKELDSYKRPSNMSEDLTQNWYYAVARMRIWGSAFLQTGNMWGDIIHPFMDWYLMGPIFGFQLAELSDGKLQRELIDTYAPQLKEVPINRHLGSIDKSQTVKRKIMSQLLMSVWHTMEKKMKYNWQWEIAEIFEYIRLKIGYTIHRSKVSTNARKSHIVNIEKYLDSRLRNNICE